MKHIFYQTKTMYSNTGDALINNALINELRNYGSLHANCSRDVPAEFLKALGIEENERINFESEFAFIRAVIKCALKNRGQVYLFSGPGDMYGGGLKLVLRNLVSGLIFPVFRIFGVTIVRIGRSVGPISRLMVFSEWIRSLFLSYYYVRDSKSLERCRKGGIKKVGICPDMSWLYDKNHVSKINNTNAVMINLRNSIFDDVENGFIETTLKSCEHVLENLISRMGDEMKVYVAYQIVEDKEFSKSVYDYFKDKYNVEYIPNQMKLEELEYYYGMVDYHISNRMHSLLAGYKYGSLPIALVDTERHTKISATFSDCDLKELMIDIYNQEDISRVTSICDNREELMNKLLDCEKEKQESICSVLDFVFSQSTK